MKKIYLSKDEKFILFSLIKNENTFNNVYINAIESLQYKDLLKQNMAISNGIEVYLSSKGRMYINDNPKLKNPTIWDDKKYIINTALSVIAVIISAVALYFSIINS